MLLLLSSSLNASVFFEDITLTRVLFPCATCPIVPILIVACLEIISGLRGFNSEILSSTFWLFDSAVVCTGVLDGVTPLLLDVLCLFDLLLLEKEILTI